MVKKLLQQRRRTGDIAPRHHLAGRKPMILAAHRSQIRALLAPTLPPGAQVLFLPACSPDLNPIELMWSKVKRCLRSAEARTQADLIAAIGQALARVTPQDALNWFAH